MPTVNESILKWTNKYGAVLYIHVHTTKSPALAARWPYTWGFSETPKLNTPDQVAWFKQNCPDYEVTQC